MNTSSPLSPTLLIRRSPVASFRIRRIPEAWRILVLSGSLCVMLCPHAWGEQKQGTNGLQGANAPIAKPLPNNGTGPAGEAGGDGEPANATANAASPHATADGGNGNRGGEGAPRGLTGTGGTGGPGGVGGQAIATAQLKTGANNAVALGGFGGEGGPGGTGGVREGGVIGNPAGTGGKGGEGKKSGKAIAVADSLGAGSTARAESRKGGNGGKGGDGLGGKAGDGGAGAPAEEARATASDTGLGASAIAVGGPGGDGGDQGKSRGLTQGDGGSAGDGGPAFAEVKGPSLLQSAVANGGRGGTGRPGFNGGTGGTGGAAEAMSKGANVSGAQATGGTGGTSGAREGGILHGNRGDGGNATAHAAAEGGVLPAIATALAKGGDPGDGVNGLIAPSGGDALAIAIANSRAGARAVATAEGGAVKKGDKEAKLGTAKVRAAANGKGDGAEGKAIVKGPVTVMAVTLKAPARSTVVAEGSVAVGIPAPEFASIAGLQAGGLIAGEPLPVDLMAALDGNPITALALQNGTHGALALAALAAGYPADGTGEPATYSSTAQWVIDTSDAPLAALPVIGLLDAVADGPAFDSLRFRVSINDRMVQFRAFFSVNSALEYFRDRVVTIGSVPTGDVESVDLRVDLELTASQPNAAFRVKFALSPLVFLPRIVISGADFDDPARTFTLRWNALMGETYSIWRSVALNSPWELLAAGFPEGGASTDTLTYTDGSPMGAAAFYYVTQP